MGYVLPEIILPLLIAALVGLLVGWFLWRWRRTRVTSVDWARMQSLAHDAGLVDEDGSSAVSRLEAELAACHDRSAVLIAQVNTLQNASAPETVAALDDNRDGAGSHIPAANEQQIPDGYPIKGNVDSMLYHRPDSRNYGATIAEVWFDTPERAEAAGFSLAPTHFQDD